MESSLVCLHSQLAFHKIRKEEKMRDSITIKKSTRTTGRILKIEETVFSVKTSFVLYDGNPDWHKLIYLGKRFASETLLLARWSGNPPYREIELFESPFVDQADRKEIKWEKELGKALAIIKKEYDKPYAVVRRASKKS